MSDEIERWCADTENWLACQERIQMLCCGDSTTSWGDWRGEDG